MSRIFATICHTRHMTDGITSNPFGTWLQEQLTARQWERIDLARRLDVPRGTVTRWLNGDRRPSTEKCRDLAEVLRWPPEYVLWKAGHLERPPRDPATYEAEREVIEMRRMLDAGVRRVEQAYASSEAMTRVRLVGIVPADSVRWTRVGDEHRAVRVPREWVADARHPLMAVEVSGDCLLSRGIADGDIVICEQPAHPQTATNGDVVVVRVGDEYALKIWHRDGDHIELRTGEGAVAFRLSILDDYEVIGIYLLRAGGRRRLAVEDW